MVYVWIVWGHIASALLFMLGHGAAASVALRLRAEREPQRVSALLDLSRASFNVGMLGLVFILATGIALGVMGGWWQWGWFWASLGLFLAISFVMTPLTATPYNRVRQALGLRAPQAFINRRMEVPDRPPTPEELEALLARARPVAAAIVGVVGIIVILWLMIFKPF